MSRASKKYPSIVIAGQVAFLGFSCLPVISGPSAATDLTAGIVMERMQGGERYTFVAGIVEGLAVARFARDNQQPTGMRCIYDWFYKSPGAVDAIYAGFQRYPTYPPGAVVDVLARQRCGG